MLPFSSSLVYPSTTVVNPNWGGVVVKTEVDSGLHNHHQQQQQLPFLDKQNMYLGSTSPNYTSSTSYKAAGNNKSFFLQGQSPTINGLTTPEDSVCHPLLRTFSSQTSGPPRSKVFYDRLLTTTTTATTTTPDVQNSDCALSLLSTVQAHTSEIGLGHNIMSRLSSSIPLVGHPTLQANGLEPIMSSVLVSNGSGDAGVHCPGMFNMGSDGNEAHQTLPSHWE